MTASRMTKPGVEIERALLHELQGRDRREGDQRHEQVVHHGRVDADGRRELRVERRDLQFLVEHHDEQQIEREHECQVHHCRWERTAGRVERNLLEGAVQHAPRVEVDVVRRLANHHQPNREENAEHYTHRSAMLDLAESRDHLRKQRRQ